MKTEGSYCLFVGDELLIESEADKELTRGTLEKGLEIQPDGTITLRLIGDVHAAGQTVQQLRALLQERYKEFYPNPAIDGGHVTGANLRQVFTEGVYGIVPFQGFTLNYGANTL